MARMVSATVANAGDIDKVSCLGTVSLTHTYFVISDTVIQWSLDTPKYYRTVAGLAKLSVKLKHSLRTSVRTFWRQAPRREHKIETTMEIDFRGSGGANSLGASAMSTTTVNAAPVNNQLLGFIVPGGPVNTRFVPTDASGLKYTLQLSAPGDLPLPMTTVTEVVCFLLPGAVLPPQHGVLVYWQVAVPGNEGFELFGSITPDRPSALFRTGWGLNEAIVSMNQQPQVVVTLGVSIEPIVNIENMPVDNTTDSRLHVAKQIATDLFTFMQSFDTGAVGNMMTVPTNIFDRWMTRFEARFRRDPNFFMKSEN